MTAIFNFNGNDLRTIEIEGAPWFMAADVCRCLNIYQNSNSQSGCIRARLDADEWRKETVLTPHSRWEGKTTRRSAVFITESGLYKLIMRSDKDTARPFQDWVTKDVLPSIRKTGGYLLNETARETAHADTRTAMPLPEEFQRVFAALLQPVLEPLRAEVVSLRDYIEKQNAMIETLVAGDAPADVWLSGHLVTEMTDKHLNNAIRWARENRTNHDVLIKERSRRNRTKRAA